MQPVKSLYEPSGGLSLVDREFLRRVLVEPYGLAALKQCGHKDMLLLLSSLLLMTKFVENAKLVQWAIFCAGHLGASSCY